MTPRRDEVKKTWVIVRVTAEVHQALNRVRESMELADELRTIELERDSRDRVSLSHVIERLIAQRDAHAARRSRSNSRRRRPTAADVAGDEPTAGDVAGEPTDPPAKFC
jgi:hypothetical protein